MATDGIFFSLRAISIVGPIDISLNARTRSCGNLMTLITIVAKFDRDFLFTERYRINFLTFNSKNQMPAVNGIGLLNT
jgi:hypothetical protein